MRTCVSIDARDPAIASSHIAAALTEVRVAASAQAAEFALPLEHGVLAATATPAAAMELYLWNVRLSAAFGEVIALAEVILRNAMAEQLAAAYGPTWYARPELFDDRTMSGFKTTWRNITMPTDPATGKPAQKTLRAVPAGRSWPSPPSAAG